MATNGKEASFTVFMSKMIAHFKSWDEAKIKQLLREKFGKYNPENDIKYSEYLCRVEAAEFAASPVEQARRAALADEQYGPEFCPTCGQKNKPMMGWWSRIYHMPGWKCEEGGITHFLMWARKNRGGDT
jgi:hypothetical protein